MATALLALGLVAIVEGLAWLLAPSALDGLLEALRRLPLDARRLVGLIAVTAGVGLVTLARAFGA